MIIFQYKIKFYSIYKLSDEYEQDECNGECLDMDGNQYTHCLNENECLYQFLWHLGQQGEYDGRYKGFRIRDYVEDLKKEGVNKTSDLERWTKFPESLDDRLMLIKDDLCGYLRIK